MRVSLIQVVLAAMGVVLLNAPVGAQEWQSLTDDVSRAELFDSGVKPAAPPLDPTHQSFALNGPFNFPENARRDQGAPRLNSIFGIDVSHYTSPDPRCTAPIDPQREIDFSTLHDQAVRFVYVKASQGVGYRDCRFVEYWSALGALPGQSLLRGAYHFLSSNRSGAEQAASFIRLMRENGGFLASDMPPALDLEWDRASADGPDRWATQTPQQIIDTAIAWLSAVKSASGRTPILYTCRAWWRERGIPDAMMQQLAGYSVWIADYSQTRRAIETPATPGASSWTLWQFAANARVTTGYGRGLDASIFKGSEADFRQALGLP